jgi:hypothetical protein
MPNMRAIILKGCGTCGGSNGAQQRILIVQSLADLGLLKTWRRRYDVVKLGLVGLPEAERHRIEEAIRDYFVCGCVAARWAAIVVIACALLACVVANETISWNMLGIIGVIILLMPLAAMLVSIVRARRRLWRTLDGLAR